jgi:hypothetical protein
MSIRRIGFCNNRSTLSSHGSKVRAVVVYVIVLVVATGCFEDHPLYPSYEALIQRGFYVYVLRNVSSIVRQLRSEFKEQWHHPAGLRRRVVAPSAISWYHRFAQKGGREKSQPRLAFLSFLVGG